MNIRQIRNATMIINYANKTFLIDPFLAKKGAYPPFPNTLNQDTFNPTVDLPIPIEEIIDADVVIVTHLHPDHFDAAAIEVLPKAIRIIAQSEEDVAVIKKAGFQNVQSIDRISSIDGISLTRTNGKHGIGEIGKMMGEVSGVVFNHPDEKTLYLAGDTIWCNDVEDSIRLHHPEVIIVNGGAAQFLQGDPIIMTKEDIYQTYLEAPQSTIIVSHMEALNHCLLTRSELKTFLDEKELSKHILVPNDGESITF
ncbi:MBL fold metallo-hydrolase [Bacillus sp. FJAT-28004]|uniref:MBL fold metallo-hydrolase n=1 Tax=Bacillus sp. FJAT-28004 TaxID=1679165 RepID=UPI0006B4B477|nr:MBL fold metallo-hydrolase [Bacillus sp. FJAT-28004]